MCACFLVYKYSHLSTFLLLLLYETPICILTRVFFWWLVKIKKDETFIIKPF